MLFTAHRQASALRFPLWQLEDRYRPGRQRDRAVSGNLHAAGQRPVARRLLNSAQLERCAGEILQRPAFRGSVDRHHDAVDAAVQAGASLDSRVDGIVVAINAAPESRTLQDFAGTSLQLSAIQQAAGDRSLASGVQVAADGSVTLPAWSVAVLELPQGESQGAGLPVSSK